jgi:hypothetical protein
MAKGGPPRSGRHGRPLQQNFFFNFMIIFNDRFIAERLLPHFFSMCLKVVGDRRQMFDFVWLLVWNMRPLHKRRSGSRPETWATARRSHPWTKRSGGCRWRWQRRCTRHRDSRLVPVGGKSFYPPSNSGDNTCQRGGASRGSRRACQLSNWRLIYLIILLKWFFFQPFFLSWN